MDLELSARVTAVTVYSEQARVTAQAQASLQEGTHRLIFGDLPLTLDVDSVRAGGKGEARVRVHGVDVRRRHYEQTPTIGVRDLEQKVEELEDQLKAITDEQDALEAQGRFLEGLRGASEQFARGLARGRTSVEEQGRISQFILDQDKGLRKRSRELERQVRELERTRDKASRELERVRSARPRERYQVIMEVEALSAGEFQAEIVYNVLRASWAPMYDVRLVEAEDGPKLEIQGIAQITQNSGQDWTNVELKVSTARTELNRRIPELKPWYVDVYHPPVPMRAASGRLRSAPAPMPMAAAQVTLDLAEPAAEVATAAVYPEEGGATVTFLVPAETTIPSDDEPHKTVLFDTRLPATVDYITVPKHTDAVFRRVKAVNEGVIPLLDGSVQLFVGDRYIGSSSIEYVPADAEVELMLGVEDRLTVERELVSREVDKARLRDKRQIHYGYEITLKNLMSQPVKVEVQDNTPVSRHEDIKIKLLRCTPEPVEIDELSLMEWHLELKSGEEAKLSYQFLVEHPRSLHVVGLVD